MLLPRSMRVTEIIPLDRHACDPHRVVEDVLFGRTGCR